MAAGAAEIGHEQHYMVTLWTLEISIGAFWFGKLNFKDMLLCIFVSFTLKFTCEVFYFTVPQFKPPRPLNVLTASTFRIFSRLSIKIASDPLFNLFHCLQYKLSTF